ncbi:MAG: flavodoxin-dependent (E)-4-hydroxy-3-methylbut-2-enyl-diphosphate synthase [Deltaproteobacteria bacterium]|uniref:4-hydroxy-3-methylbut-2-en-1-yl diphosphate synthase (flavodoxin) n=1 Tax=Candidatus Zymogenus saltonus TaxID=2844893 RepID=A0A9D8KE31_9DELT|nr:flavodoxin-dependent (E)-4-hydroxy-3-methylbut-2-enyl-diphosphate synthase [Candidatus Zymogenus saltonus]
MITRRQTRAISVGDVRIGGENPVVVQSMTKTDTKDVKATLSQIEDLYKRGCEIVRVAVKDMDATSALKEIVKESPVPIIADIHFDYLLAIYSMEAGAKGIRINPGNIGGRERLLKIIDRARLDNVAIRIGVNSGSLEKEILNKHGGPTPRAMVESGLNCLRIFEDSDYTNTKFSLKSANVMDTVYAYREFSKVCDYPLHLGVTEAGTVFKGAVKSAVGIGILLYEGIGDTIRVSLTGDPVKEVICAYTILSALGIRKRGVNVISCPTCGRTEIDIVKIADEVERRLEGLDLNITVAVMGCEVNGPGEAREADVGIAGGKGMGLLFRNGKVIKKVKEAELLDELIKEVEKIRAENESHEAGCH